MRSSLVPLASHTPVGALISHSLITCTGCSLHLLFIDKLGQLVLLAPLGRPSKRAPAPAYQEGQEALLNVITKHYQRSPTKWDNKKMVSPLN
jgi:hypothetical protein